MTYIGRVGAFALMFLIVNGCQNRVEQTDVAISVCSVSAYLEPFPNISTRYVVGSTLEGDFLEDGWELGRETDCSVQLTVYPQYDSDQFSLYQVTQGDGQALLLFRNGLLESRHLRGWSR